MCIRDREEKVRSLQPAVVAVLGLTAYRQAFGRPKATAGEQPELLGCARLWVLPNPSGLNAHETVQSLAAAYAAAHALGIDREVALRAILGQQVSVRAATTIAGRIASAFGEPIETPFPELTTLAPTAERLAGLGDGEMSGFGLTGPRAKCVRTLAGAVVDGSLVLEAGADPDATVERLEQLRGVGPWTAHYITMRALAWPDAFPHADLVLRKALGDASPKVALDRSQAWRPWRAYAAMHLWRGYSHSQNRD